MPNVFDFQVSWNSTNREAALRLVEIGPRRGETEKLRLTRDEAVALKRDLGAAIEMMDTMRNTWGEPEVAQPGVEILEEPEVIDG